MTRKNWVESEETQLSKLYKTSIQIWKIAQMMGRTESSIKNKAHILRLKKNNANLIHPDLKPSPDLCYVIGALVGDGHVTSNALYRIHLKVKSKEFANAFFEALENIGLNPNTCFCSDRRFSTQAKSKIFCRWYHSLSPLNIKAIVSQRKELIASFLRGFYDAEGSLNRNTHLSKFYNSNIKLLLITQQCLTDLGFKTSLVPHKRNGFTNTQIYALYVLGGKETTKSFLTLIKPNITSKSRWEK